MPRSSWEHEAIWIQLLQISSVSSMCVVLTKKKRLWSTFLNYTPAGSERETPDPGNAATTESQPPQRTNQKEWNARFLDTSVHPAFLLCSAGTIRRCRQCGLSLRCGLVLLFLQMPVSGEDYSAATTSRELLKQISTTVDLITFTLLLFEACCEFSVTTHNSHVKIITTQ